MSGVARQLSHLVSNYKLRTTKIVNFIFRIGVKIQDSWDVKVKILLFSK